MGKRENKMITETLITLTVLLIIMALGTARRVMYLHRRFDQDLNPSEECLNRLERSEKIWRYSTHLFSFLCLFPVPWVLTQKILQLTTQMKIATSGAATVGLIWLGLNLPWQRGHFSLVLMVPTMDRLLSQLS